MEERVQPLLRAVNFKTMGAALRASIAASVEAAIAEDVGSGDITAAIIPESACGWGSVITRQAGVFCGRPWVEEVRRQLNSALELDWRIDDGDDIKAGQLLFKLHGAARSVMSAERVMLNFVQLLSATATQTRRFSRLLKGTGCQLLDTRKTIPGLRLAQKYAVHCGGGGNHRLGLFDVYLIKENHIAAARSIANAVHQARRQGPGRTLEVEVESLAELDEALEAGADIIMIDNFSIAETVDAVAMSRGRAKLEASGGVNEERIRAIAETGVDYVSVGGLTKEVRPLDLSMRFASR